MRLIDADELKVYLQEYLHYEHAIPWVDAQPTAYDVEKVVEELKEWSFETEIVIPGSDGYDDTANRKIICTDNAIDIVRKGRVI